ncbi:hypothetical protein V6N11_016074 [Hibiscus sabdariffa]|uniref:RNase H type-1 domain-containing protein n=1 Tax=Hibiscus sabdariffa TaxID=183260 RepID=A0ABR2TUA0_9ROSI
MACSKRGLTEKCGTCETAYYIDKHMTGSLQILVHRHLSPLRRIGQAILQLHAGNYGREDAPAIQRGLCGKDNVEVARILDRTSNVFSENAMAPSIRALLTLDWDIVTRHIPRTTNGVADRLAKLSRGLTGEESNSLNLQLR